MVRFAWLALLVCACGTTDDRPLTLPYITEAVLAPTCGRAECHSTFRQEQGDVFDTVTASRKSIVDNALVTIPDDPKNPTSYIYISITVGQTSRIDPSFGLVRMPYDAPMPNEDIALIYNWIQAGAPGAQCVPDEGNTCSGDNVVACDADGNAGTDVIMSCTTACSSGVCVP
jgi:hypothetical protein